MEVKKSGGDVNSASVQACVERAKKDSMPKDVIERALAKGSGADGSSLEEVMYEGYGPGGVAILIQAVTDNNNRTAPEIRHIFSKAGLELGAPGSAAWAFTKTDEGYIPTTPMEIDDKTGEKLAEFIEKLEEQDDVTNIYSTADTPDE
jgi:transcriptional/translational regulatory protein YebC/TACO1